MRSALRLLALIAVWGFPLAAQQPRQASPFVLSVGPAWTQLAHLPGVQVRAEYRLARYRWLGLQLDAGAYWRPTQSYSLSSGLYGDGSTFEATGQDAHVHLGLAGTVTPFPRAWFSPYGLIGIAGVQSWSTGHGYYRRADGSVAYVVPHFSGTFGNVEGFMGLGLRFRLGARPVQLEVRRLGGRINAFTIGTALRF